MLLLVVTVIALAVALSWWSNVRRMQYRRGHPDPLPAIKPTVLESLRLAFDPAAPRLLAAGVALVLAAAAGAVTLRWAGAAAGLWLLVGWVVWQARAVWQVRNGWREAVLSVAAEALGFPENASVGRWVFVQKWVGRTDPALTVVRCPEGFTPSPAGPGARLAAQWNAHPVLGAKYTWNLQFGPQRQRPDQFQVVAFPTLKPGGEQLNSADLMSARERPEAEGMQQEERSGRAGALLRRLLRTTVRVLRVALPVAAAAAGAWVVGRNPEQAGQWLRGHLPASAALAAPVVAGLAWSWLRLGWYEPQRGAAVKPSLMLMREFYGLTFWEDRWFIRLPSLALFGFGVRTAATHTAWVPGVVVIGAWTVLAWLRAAAVARQRSAVLHTMYAIARVNLDYDRHWKQRKGDRPVGEWKRVRISWQSTYVPGAVQVAFPTELRTTSSAKMRQFREEWNQKAFPPSARHPGLEWDVEADMRARALTCHPYVPVNPTDVRLGEIVPADPLQFLPGQSVRTGSWIAVDLRDSPHVLVCGETGSGKSATMESLAFQKARTGWEVQIADAGGSGGWARWEGRPGVVPAASGGPDACAVALTYPQIGAMFAELRQEVDRRKELLVRHRVSKLGAVPPEQRPAYRLVMCDEWLSMLTSVSSKAKDPDSAERRTIATQVWSDWSYVILEGRKVGVHSVTGAQRPDASMFGGAFRDNIGIRIACGAMTDAGLRMMFGDGYKAPPGFVVQEGEEGDSGLPRGRMLVRPGSGRSVVVVQGAWFGGENNDEDLELHLPARGSGPRRDAYGGAAAPAAGAFMPDDVLTAPDPVPHAAPVTPPVPSPAPQGFPVPAAGPVPADFGRDRPLAQPAPSRGPAPAVVLPDADDDDLPPELEPPRPRRTAARHPQPPR
ncbi:FtsK/SpoIIIE domain-containing protein [Wenjunlia tyrosinilytica]|uniref:FtsK domain-containing protein n=1 Tax=Wenjunlia tyrosinilytica TaxID=1544741 RepID=A0A918E208_9ACTN|nr:FtsK/SpoIIIE domain-containing protein [Wenjunlia tyrosinilytica]GGO98030.1 hypothetical protein GCM10012280_61210 [Wenjunlia tyrosinilytica]